MGIGAGFYVYGVVEKFTFAISSPDEFLSTRYNAVITSFDLLCLQVYLSLLFHNGFLALQAIKLYHAPI